MKPTPYDYSSVLSSFFETAGELPEHTQPLKPLVETAARRALSHPDVAYMPAFKVLDLLSALVNLCVGIAREPHLRLGEAKAMLQQLITDTAPLLSHFYREAALERVRYEPVMLPERYTSALEKRNAVLCIRLDRMCGIYTDAALLSPITVETVRQAAEEAMHSDDFLTYRAGPMCQLFAEMLQTATSVSDPQSLRALIGPEGRVWKSFRLKAHRYSADDSDPLVTGDSPERIDSPIPVTHHLH